MPRLDNMESTKLPTGNYGFSAQRIEDLGASEYTLVTLAVDDSSSVQPSCRKCKDASGNL